MGKTSTAHHSKRMYWEGHVTQYNASSMSKAAYCRKHNLVYHQFVWWQCRLQTEEDTSTTHFIELGGRLKAQAHEYPLVIEIGGIQVKANVLVYRDTLALIVKQYIRKYGDIRLAI